MHQSVVTRGKSKQIQGTTEVPNSSTKVQIPRLNLRNNCKLNTSYEVVISPTIKSSRTCNEQSPTIRKEEKELEEIKNQLHHAQTSNSDLRNKILQLNAELKNCKSMLSDNEILINQLRSDLSQKTVSKVFIDSSSQTEDVTRCNQNIVTKIVGQTDEQPVLETSKPLLLKKDGENKRRGRVLLLADSHGRGAASVLRSDLESYQVSSLFKPNASFEGVVKDLRAITNDFGRNDFVVIMAGVNDILKSRRLTKQKILDVLKVLSNTNTIIISIPFCPRRHVLNNFIFEANLTLYEAIASANHHNVFFVDSNSVIDFGGMTREGLHLNRSGKWLLFQCVSKLILQNHPHNLSTVCHDNLIYITTSDNGHDQTCSSDNNVNDNCFLEKV